MKPFLFACALTALWTPATAQQNPFDVEFEITDLGHGIHMLQGLAGNVALSVGDDGAFLVDSEVPALTDKLRGAISQVTDEPIAFVLNTHWHYDHVGGNTVFGKDGALIIAHDTVRERMNTPQVSPLSGEEIPVQGPEGRAIITFNEGLSLNQNGEEVRMTHVNPAHTDGDVIVEFRGANILHLGDLFFNRQYPYVDAASNGSYMGLIESIEYALTLVDDETQIIPGHGELATKADLVAYHDMLVDVTTTIQGHIDAGLSLDETVGQKPTAAYDEVWGQSLLKPDFLVTIVYKDLSR